MTPRRTSHSFTSSTASASNTPHDTDTVPSIVHQNIEALVAARNESDRRRTFQDHMADWVTSFSGNMVFVYLHVLWFGSWIAINLGVGGAAAFDPYPFGMLTTIVSLEAIFLSTFVLISQNRQALLADRRADLNLQTDLLAEHELTRVLRLLDAVAAKVGISEDARSDEAELEEDIHPDAMLHQLEQATATQKTQKS